MAPGKDKQPLLSPENGRLISHQRNYTKADHSSTAQAQSVTGPAMSGARDGPSTGTGEGYSETPQGNASTSDQANKQVRTSNNEGLNHGAVDRAGEEHIECESLSTRVKQHKSELHDNKPRTNEVTSSSTQQQSTFLDIVRGFKLSKKKRELSPNHSTTPSWNSYSSRGFGDAWSRIKSFLASSAKPSSSSRTESSQEPGASEGAYSNKLSKSVSKSEKNHSSESESTPFFPNSNRQQRRPGVKPSETMTEKSEEGSRFFVYYLSCFATIGGLLFGYDTGKFATEIFTINVLKKIRLLS
ncbi:hypothetical protein PoB_004216600 [Plakobranchus ocellatus]|uniref:Major facilitator superfamily (MFS) profile domain-containing protein n=1 Tax=Plakobranchus ocellatus TaxID=259542 RepID=A0AAV4BA28_9GAST|nr:hypothetical protein PoB_004216600 [Plakobranchus ocellatus]